MAVGVPWAASSPGYHALDSILTKVPLHVIFNHFKLSEFSFLLQFLSQEKIQKSPQIITHGSYETFWKWENTKTNKPIILSAKSWPLNIFNSIQLGKITNKLLTEWVHTWYTLPERTSRRFETPLDIFWEHCGYHSYRRRVWVRVVMDGEHGGTLGGGRGDQGKPPC